MPSAPVFGRLPLAFLAALFSFLTRGSSRFS
jgi:hypothetical protein